MVLKSTPNQSTLFGLVCLLLLVCVGALLVFMGNQQGLQESVISLLANQPEVNVSSNAAFSSVWGAPLFSQLLRLLPAVPWVVQALWAGWLVGGFFAIEAIGNALLSPVVQRRLFLGLVFGASLLGCWQFSAINFQTYATVWVLLFCWVWMLWLKAKTAPIKGDALTPWRPIWFDALIGLGLAIITVELGWVVSFLLLALMIFRHQQVSTALPATWYVRSIVSLRWVWIGFVLGLLAETTLLYCLGQGWLFPLLRIPPTLPEWTGWETNLSSIWLRVFSLLGAFFPWHGWLWHALTDLWVNVKKGGTQVSLFLDSERPPLQLLSSAGIVLGVLWVVFPSFWVGWSCFLLSHVLILTDWLTATCTLTVDLNRFKRSVLWTSLLLLALGLLGLVWQSHTTSFQFSEFPTQLQGVFTLHSLWCVLGGCLGLLMLWQNGVQPKRCSIGLTVWFLGWMLIQATGVAPLSAWQGGNKAAVEAVLKPRLWNNALETKAPIIGVCLDAAARSHGVFPKLVGSSTVTANRVSATTARMIFHPLPITTCFSLHHATLPVTKALPAWLLLPELVYYENRRIHPQWQPPLMGLTMRGYQFAFGTLPSPSLLQPLLLPFMMPQQETWVLIPVHTK
jgi:hypothetical protein